MSTPVTRGEPPDGFQQFKARLDQSLEQREQRLAQKLDQEPASMATMTELEIWGEALLARLDPGERRFAQQLLERIASSEQRLLAEIAEIAEIASPTRSIQESTQISVVDEKYDDLPARVTQLEVTVFSSEQC